MGSNENRANLASHHDDVGFEVPERPYIRSQFPATATTTHAMSVPMVPAERLSQILDENLTFAGIGGERFKVIRAGRSRGLTVAVPTHY